MSRVLALFLIFLLTLSFMACNIQFGADESAEFGKGNSDKPEGARQRLVHLSVPYTVDEFVDRARQSDVIVVKLFLTAGMNLNAKDKDGVTALQAATKEGHAEIVKLLKKASAKE